MNIQIFGKPKSFDTKKAERWFKERRIKYQYIDLVTKGVSPGEYRSIRAAVGSFDALLDKTGDMLEALPPIVHFEEEVSYDDSVKPGTFEVVRDGAVFEVVGSSMQRLIDSVNFDDEESMSWFHRTLRRWGVIDMLREAGAEVLGVASIFTYGMQKGLDRLAAAEVKNISLTNLDVLSEVAADEGYIKPEDVSRLIAFRNNPSDESWIGGAK